MDQLLVEEIVKAARKAFLELFKNGEQYYYCTLVTTGEGLVPLVSAWSYEALTRANIKQPTPRFTQYLKWSYSDSPYFNFGAKYFTKVKEIISSRPYIEELDTRQWETELILRLSAMEKAMKILDEEGVFQKNQPREMVCILAELVPPAKINTEIALRLNDPQHIGDWLKEAAE
jgi:hypothetical protein